MRNFLKGEDTPTGSENLVFNKRELASKKSQQTLDSFVSINPDFLREEKRLSSIQPKGLKRSTRKKLGVLPTDEKKNTKPEIKELKFATQKDELDLIEEENLPSTSRDLVKDSQNRRRFSGISKGLFANHSDHGNQQNQSKSLRANIQDYYGDKVCPSESSSDKENSSYDYNRVESPVKLTRLNGTENRQMSTPKLASVKKPRNDNYSSGAKKLESSVLSRDDRLIVSTKMISSLLKRSEFSFTNNLNAD